MPFNALRTGKSLPLNASAWNKAYKPLSNWPIQQWLHFQTLQPGLLEDGLRALHSFQTQYNIKDEDTQKYMLDWLLQATQWDKTSLSTWSAWSALLTESPTWSVSIQAYVISTQANTLLRVEPEQYEDIAKVQHQLGRYWNQVRSRIPTYQHLRDRNANTAWETYGTFRKEVQQGALLDHSDNVRWHDFCRLATTSPSWREALVPLYKQWLEHLPNDAIIENTSIDLWIETLERHGMNPCEVAMPALDESRMYHLWSAPSSWHTNTSPGHALARVQFLEKLMKRESSEFDDLYSSGCKLWALDTCMTHCGQWSLEQRKKLFPFFIMLCQSKDGEHFSRSTYGGQYHVHTAMSAWFPEYQAQLDGLRGTMQTLGLDFKKKDESYYGNGRLQYTGKSALEEFGHYIRMLDALLMPISATPSEDFGHLFELDNNDFLMK